MNRFWEQGYNRIRRAAACLAAVLLALPVLSAGPCRMTAYAATWCAPQGTIQAGSAVVMDADTNTVLWGTHQNDPCYPASITKIMTALLVIEHCSLDEKVTFSSSAVRGLESGAVTIGAVPGDVLSVEDCLHALLLHSANEVANALAEHVSGSVEAFCALMNQRAEELGCRHTCFRNPNGLTDGEHLTTAYDMALIGAACMDNETFLRIESADSYRTAPTEKCPDGCVFSMGHKMLKKGTNYTDSRVIGGKTGYIQASGNTLVTMAEDQGRRLVIVVMKDKNPAHYLDTGELMEFGFQSFVNVDATDRFSAEETAKRLQNDKVIPATGHTIMTDGPLICTLPRGADTGSLAFQYEYNLPAGAPEGAAAILKAEYAGVRVGQCYIIDEPESNLEMEEVQSPAEQRQGGRKALPVRPVTVLAAGAVLSAALIAALFLIRLAEENRKQKRKREQLRKKRLSRLRELNLSEEQFEAMNRKLREEQREKPRRREENRNEENTGYRDESEG